MMARSPANDASALERRVSAAKLERDRTALVVVDVQEGFRPVIGGFEDVARQAATLVQAARVLDLPVVVTEQYPKGLGPTVPELAEHLDGVEPLPKTIFSAPCADGFDLQGRDQAIVCGIETHICVMQSALDLVDRGVHVEVAADAVSSRTELNRDVGLERMREAGARLTTVETALFELLRRAGTDEFKAIQKLIR
jgi:nicotinamidase-related amidase